VPRGLVARQFNEIESLGGLADEFHHMRKHGTRVDSNDFQLVAIVAAKVEAEVVGMAQGVHAGAVGCGIGPGW
jgi:hypothetical protein